jgi:membrane protein implicated in regulation of membrane protease activity
MADWFSNLEFLSKVYWLVAIIGSLIFTVVMIMAFTGGDADDIGDVDSDMDADAGAGFQFITFKNLVGFFTIFGWSGIACIDAGLSTPITIIISVISGLLMMVIMAALFFFINKLTDSGTLNYKNAIDAIGEVYLTIGADRSKMGKVTVSVQGTMRELDALTDSLTELKSGTIIKVVDVTSNGILIVDQTRKPIEPSQSKNEQLQQGENRLLDNN